MLKSGGRLTLSEKRESALQFLMTGGAAYPFLKMEGGGRLTLSWPLSRTCLRVITLMFAMSFFTLVVIAVAS